MACNLRLLQLAIQLILYSAGAVLLIISIPFFILPCLPVYAFRYCLKIYCKYFRPEFGKILSTTSSLMATDDLYVKPTATIIVAVVLEGRLEREVFTRTFVDKILNARNLQGEACYPELKQYITTWCGFSFWRHVENFDVRNYIRVYNENDPNHELHEKDLMEFCNRSIEESYRKFQSPWSLTLVHNYKPANDTTDMVKTALFVRYHHALSDGFSMLKLINKLFDKPLEVPTASKKSISFGGMLKDLVIPFIVPYRVVKLMFTAYDVNDWHLKTPVAQSVKALLAKIPVSYIKEIQALHRVSSLTTVIFAGYAGAIRRAMLERGFTVPDTINCIIPITVPGHPDDKLRNYATVISLELPVGNPDPVARLKIIDRNFVAIKTDPTPIMVFPMAKFVGGLFTWMIRPLMFNIWSTLVATSFMGPRVPIFICGLKCSDIAFGTGFFIGNRAGIGMSTLTYDGNIRICLAIDKSLLAKMPNPSVEDILSGIGYEFYVIAHEHPYSLWIKNKYYSGNTTCKLYVQATNRTAGALNLFKELCKRIREVTGEPRSRLF